MELTFTAVGTADIELLQNIAKETFRETYEHLNDPDEFKNYLNSAFNKEQLLSEIRNKESFYYFVFLAKELIGYYKLNIGEAQSENMTSEYAELERIYLYEKYHGNGIGGKMIAQSERHARNLGAKLLWLGVWEKNINAIAFYKKMGYTIFDTHYFVIGHDHQTDYMMKKSLY